MALAPGANDRPHLHGSSYDDADEWYPSALAIGRRQLAASGA